MRDCEDCFAQIHEAPAPFGDCLRRDAEAPSIVVHMPSSPDGAEDELPCCDVAEAASTLVVRRFGSSVSYFGGRAPERSPIRWRI